MYISSSSCSSSCSYLERIQFECIFFCVVRDRWRGSHPPRCHTLWPYCKVRAPFPVVFDKRADVVLVAVRYVPANDFCREGRLGFSLFSVVIQPRLLLPRFLWHDPSLLRQQTTHGRRRLSLLSLSLSSLESRKLNLHIDLHIFLDFDVKRARRVRGAQSEQLKSSEKENRNEMSLSDENEKPLANAGLELAESLAGLMNSTSKEIGEGKEKKEKTEAAPAWPLREACGKACPEFAWVTTQGEGEGEGSGGATKPVFERIRCRVRWVQIRETQTQRERKRERER